VHRGHRNSQSVEGLNAQISFRRGGRAGDHGGGGGVADPCRRHDRDGAGLAAAITETSATEQVYWRHRCWGCWHRHHWWGWHRPWWPLRPWGWHRRHYWGWGWHWRRHYHRWWW
jgi:hypothetical protein